MTVVSTPAPRLPLRRRSVGPGVSPMLRRLAAERATGVLLRERGSLHLADGQVTYAESPESPGLDVLLATGGVLDAEVWREAVARAGTDGRVGRFLVDSGRVTEGALELCHAAALFDAAYFVLGPSGAPARFRYGAAHWLGPVRPVPVAALERETLRRRELLHRIWPDPATDTAPLIRADRAAEPPVPARQQAVLDQVNGVRTAADISFALGRPAFHTLVELRRLATAGIVTTASQPPRPSRPSRPPQADPAPEQPPPALDPASALLTQSSADPDVALLRRVRDALEAL
ncbi:hypothetical protein [Streptomyces yerevanensis]|uniref:hypothetical protein n=1 Tax=Streptomyces yerevanensis TaxID=66378 RepID=UPI0005245AD6|nr:hypothetical protein [Streptomyces yerevanensis]